MLRGENVRLGMPGCGSTGHLLDCREDIATRRVVGLPFETDACRGIAALGMPRHTGVAPFAFQSATGNNRSSMYHRKTRRTISFVGNTRQTHVCARSAPNSISLVEASGQPVVANSRRPTSQKVCSQNMDLLPPDEPCEFVPDIPRGIFPSRSPIATIVGHCPKRPPAGIVL